MSGLTIAFHLVNFNERGIVRSTIDFAHFNERLLGNRSIVVAPKEYDCDRTLTPSIMEPMVRQRFPVFDYDDIPHMRSILQKEGADLLYIQKSGGVDEVHGGQTPTAIHAVFEFEPHREKYAYISSWMAKEAERHLGSPGEYVPLMVYGPKKAQTNLRRRLGIPENATVLGRHGGFPTFDLPFALDGIVSALDKRSDLYFIFMNTPEFYRNERIVYLQPETNLQKKADFILACDGMLHARSLGESFGLSVAEFLYHGKPVMAWSGGRDQNHVKMLGEHGLFYSDEASLLRLLLEFDKSHHRPEIYRSLVSESLPEQAIKAFERVFLSDLKSIDS